MGPVIIDEEIDLTEDTDDENITDEGDTKPIENGTASNDGKPNEAKSVRNYQKLLDKAIEEIKKGGSLKSVSVLYNIPEEALYQKLVSRSLPKETELLTSFEENQMVRWILRSNENNSVVTKQNLMERVGKMKKVLRITPIFCRSKFGKMWYDHFLKTHSEIFELEGIILPSVNYRRVFAKRLKKAASNNNTRYKEKIKVTKKENIDLVSLYKIKEVTIILQDFRKLKNFDYTDEGNGCYTKTGARSKSKVKSSESTLNQNLDEEFAGIENEVNENVRLMGNDNMSNLLNSETKVSYYGNKWEKQDRTCELCNKMFPHPIKLKKHLRIYHSKGELPFSCYKCMKGFTTKSECTHHMRIVHRRKHLVKCVMCDKSFKNQASLSFHVQKHHKSKSKFVCETCDKKFNYRQTLEQHVMYIHLKKEKPFPCDVCGKCFIKPSIVARHRHTHSQVKPLPCPCCPKQFLQKYLLQKHIDICLTKGNRRTKQSMNKNETEDASEDVIIID